MYTPFSVSVATGGSEERMMKRSAAFLIMMVLLVATTLVNAATIDYFIWDDWGGNWADAEKSTSNTEDDSMCWAATASNILEWARWCETDLTNTDQIFGYFRDHWTDSGGRMNFGWDWWFDGTYDGPLTWSYPDVPGGGFYPGVNFSDYFRQSWNPSGSMSVIDQYLHDGYGTGLGLYDSSDGHAVTVWGFTFDSDATDYYTGIYVTDSDDDKDGPPIRPDSLRYYNVTFDEKWYLQNYGGSDDWYIGDIQGLALNPGFTHAPEPATLLLLAMGSLALLKKSRGYRRFSFRRGSRTLSFGRF